MVFPNHRKKTRYPFEWPAFKPDTSIWCLDTHLFISLGGNLIDYLPRRPKPKYFYQDFVELHLAMFIPRDHHLCGTSWSSCRFIAAKWPFSQCILWAYICDEGSFLFRTHSKRFFDFSVFAEKRRQMVRAASKCQRWSFIADTACPLYSRCGGCPFFRLSHVPFGY